MISPKFHFQIGNILLINKKYTQFSVHQDLVVHGFSHVSIGPNLRGKISSLLSKAKEMMLEMRDPVLDKA